MGTTIKADPVTKALCPLLVYFSPIVWEEYIIAIKNPRIVPFFREKLFNKLFRFLKSRNIVIEVAAMNVLPKTIKNSLTEPTVSFIIKKVEPHIIVTNNSRNVYI